MKLIREPLLHFALAGGLLFGAHSWLNRGRIDAGGADRTVRITEREVAWLTETWRTTRQRAPDDRELQGLVVNYLREELLAREARELELDRDDTVVRRRLAQKMTFLLEDTARLAEPSDGELRALYDADRTRYAEPSRTSFEQVYLSRERRGERTSENAARMLALLERDATAAPAEELGDPSLLSATLVDAEPSVISAQFGEEFAAAVGALEPDAWTGPISSAFGLHLVRVTARQPARQRPFEAVRDELVAEWRRQREAAAKDDYTAALLRKYDVQVAESVRPLLGSSIAALKGE